ncbi:MAG: DEAD/DEAH box helicase, partial [Phycisphaerae bacterium]
GVLPDIRRIPRAIPRERQSLLFSATMPQPIRVLASEMLRDPVSVEVARVSAPAVKVSHAVYHVEMPEKLPLLIDLLNQAPGDRALVFTRTKHGADKVVRILEREGIPAAAMHGNKSQNARNRALEGFRTGKTPVLVATDLAARGLDVDDIALVVNYDLTPDPETYIHRIGRTGRAGASGHAISFCTPTEQSDLRAIEKLLRVPMEHIRRTPSRAKVSQAVSPHRPERHEKTRSPRRQRRRARTAR